MAAAIIRLAERRRLSLDDPRYEAAILAEPQHEWTRDEQVHRLVEWCDPIGAPGERKKYSDTGYELPGGIVVRMTGRNLVQAVQGLVDYEKLGLRSTWWEVDEPAPAGAGPRAHQYYGDKDTYDWNPSLDLYGGGGLQVARPPSSLACSSGARQRSPSTTYSSSSQRNQV